MRRYPHPPAEWLWSEIPYGWLSFWAYDRHDDDNNSIECVIYMEGRDSSETIWYLETERNI